jgi:hypothetical protein
MQQRVLGESGLVELMPGDPHEIEAALAEIPVHGARYPAHLQARVGR